ncbi:MAG: NAD+ synthase [Phycisphaerae bacterium]|nr:MAG: NAD+ synthase [Planctomycetia bacterium]RIK67383.1 MAG: NAD+ synthase [Planctomycetota bacterium]GJQ27542.1 MAG: NAD+ synthase [Phycisphaerae bacterium]
MRLALAQINPLVGDVTGNATKIEQFAAQAGRAGADLVVFPELTLCGYPPRDLLLKPRFVEDVLRTTSALAERLRDGPAMLVGTLQPSEKPVGRRLHNALALLQGGRVAATFHKSLLPTYDVFDEHRYFEPAQRPGVYDLPVQGRDVRIGVTICEDLWNDKRFFDRPLYERNPLDDLVGAGATLIVNSSASPFIAGKQAFREKLLGSQAAAIGRPIAIVNQIGGNDELIFDGASAYFDATGRLVARAKAFDEDLLIVETDPPAAARIEPYPDDLDSIRQALVLGTRDYVRKCGFTDVVLGLSGGIDSALTAAIAVEALSPARVHGVAMPSRFSSDHSLDDARALAANLGIDYRVIPIEPMHAAIETHLAPHFDGRPPDTTEENMQARLRGNILMSLSNKFGWLLLTTGNKSELAVGYCTLYGDMCGGLAVISDVPKTVVYQLSRAINARAGREIIPARSITKPPSAELRPDQHDQQSLPPYDDLDAILHHYVEQEESADQIIARGFDAAVVRDVVRKVDMNEYKRKQAATGLKVTSRAFGVGRRMPIAARFG